ncbi:MAG: transposase [Oceanospirillaceae bacterium]|nr:transposase [Oceanospirillaceae bacterium]
MSRYNQNIKHIAVQKFLQGKQSIGHIAQQLEIEPSALRKWIRHYQQQGYTALTKKYSHYSPQFKRNVLHYMRAQGISYQQAAAVLISVILSIAQWARQYDTRPALTLNRVAPGTQTQRKNRTAN